MSNPIKTEYDKMSITKDITERENIVRQFQMTGFLNRNDAIKKISKGLTYDQAVKIKEVLGL